MSDEMPPRGGDEDEDDWIEKVVRMAAKLGFNEVRLRWKLMHLQQWWEGRQIAAQRAVEHAQYENKVCPWCGGLNDKADEVCHQCKRELPSHRWQTLSRLGLVASHGWTVSSLICFCNLIVYARICWEYPGEGILDLPSAALVRFGGHVPFLVQHAGELWRLGTAMFLHIGIWHLGFNMIALSQVGPLIEREFGRARMLFLYMVTGVVANVASGALAGYGISAGASGAIMGLVGAAAMWGHRHGGRLGLHLRDEMIKWAFLVFVIGGWIGADNYAHAFGMLSGALVAWLLEPKYFQRGEYPWVDKGCGAVGITLMTACVWLCLFPPATAAAAAIVSGWGG